MMHAWQRDQVFKREMRLVRTLVARGEARQFVLDEGRRLQTALDDSSLESMMTRLFLQLILDQEVN